MTITHLKQAIGILGGTFDPIHFGHLRTALEIHQTLELAEVRIVPCYQPVHRKPPIASPEQRLAMVRAAIESEPALQADSTEIDRKGPSYTIDTLEYFHKNSPHQPLCLIMGIDALLSFSTWHRWEDILDLAYLVVAHRPQYQLPETGSITELIKTKKIILHPVTALEISATDIRKQISLGLSPRFLLPDAVYHYIQQNNTY